jgi:hypothetical protein
MKTLHLVAFFIAKSFLFPTSGSGPASLPGEQEEEQEEL